MDDSTVPEKLPSYSIALVREVFKQSFEGNPRVSDDALALSAEYLRLFTVEAIHRSLEEKKKSNIKASKKTSQQGPAIGPILIESQHLEKVSAGIELDFGA
ncbi:hypothetical protein BT69DRAFT_1354486 [Atractiella rhizophila]|nr:hypothetical protein BT69DRAFT_1354486 [Atractiella rhizophila]